MIDNIRVASPCSADWEQMQGDDRVRHCDACNLNVYNLAAFTETEIRALVASRKGRLCGRMYQRGDGTVLTQNCPVGLQAVTRRISRIAGAVFAFLAVNFTAGLPLFAQSYTQTNVSSAGLSLGVVGPAGEPVANGEVTLKEPSRKQTLHGRTDHHGRLVLSGLRAARYEMTVSALGGLRSLPQTIELRAGEMLSLPVKLDLQVLMGEIVSIEPRAKH
ncbi:MAG TPA: carboxypeptidase-like regulatory domain-containing protein [Candidatus Angelobacter sp.]|jgi:hypothetical protein